jgi:hypothetical protein
MFFIRSAVIVSDFLCHRFVCLRRFYQCWIWKDVWLYVVPTLRLFLQGICLFATATTVQIVFESTQTVH